MSDYCEHDTNIVIMDCCKCLKLENERLDKLNRNLVKAAKVLVWGQNRIVQEYWDNLRKAIAKAEGE